MTLNIPNKTNVKGNIHDIEKKQGQKGPYLSLVVVPTEFPDETLYVNLFFSSEKAVEISQEALEALGYKGDPADVNAMFSELKDTEHEFYVRHDSYQGKAKYRVNVSKFQEANDKDWAEAMRAKLKAAGVKQPDEFE